MRELERARSASLFATPLRSHVWPEAAGLNAESRERILAHEHSHPGQNRTNVGGWHSDPGMIEFRGGAGERPARLRRTTVEEATYRLYADFQRAPAPLNWVLSAWANVNRRGDLNQLHTHPGATWSGVHYGDADAVGAGTPIHRSMQRL